MHFINLPLSNYYLSITRLLYLKLKLTVNYNLNSQDEPVKGLSLLKPQQADHRVGQRIRPR